MTQTQYTEFVVLQPGIAEGSGLTVLKKEAAAEFLKNHTEYTFSETRNGYDWYILKGN